MKKKINLRDSIVAPRPLDLTVYFVLSICLFVPGAMLLFAALFALMNNSFKDFLIGFSVSVLPIGLGALSFFMSAKSRTRILFDQENNHISVLRRGAEEKIIEVERIEHFYSKRVTYPFPGTRKYSLDVILDGNESIRLFDELLITPAIKWERFAEKLARKIKKPLKAESCVEDKKLSLFNMNSK